MHQTPPPAAAPSSQPIFFSGAYDPLHFGTGDRRWWTVAAEPARQVTVALDAFPTWPGDRQLHAMSDADYWETKALDHITTLAAALVLHKQLTSGTEVPRSLSYALNAMQVEIATRIRRAIRRHVSNGGLHEAGLRQAWGDAA